MPNLRKRIRDLEETLTLIKTDLVMRGTKSEDGTTIVNLGNSVWFRLNDALNNAELEAHGLPQEPDKLPTHHKQWFTQLKKASAQDDLALMSCLDAKTLEHRSVISLVSHVDGEYQLTPIGHLCPEDNPYEAYLPPRTEEQEIER